MHRTQTDTVFSFLMWLGVLCCVSIESCADDTQSHADDTETHADDTEEPVSWVGMEPGQSQTVPLSQETAEAREQRLQWWREARFGMFIHWSPISLKGTEIGWSRDNGVPKEEYDKLYESFNPTRFDADRIVRIAKDAGMKYLVFTTKHHDGFCMFDTQEHDYNIMHTPYGQDICAQLAKACRAHGVRFCTYYSVTDWYHPLHPLDSPGGQQQKPNANIGQYAQVVDRQIAELVNNYGPLGIMWYDYPQSYSENRGKRLYETTRALQHDIIVNDRTGAGGDYHTPEQRLGKFNTDQPWESCITIGKQWSWHPQESPKSLEACVHSLVMCAAGDGNLLLNIGLSPLGEVEESQAERLREIGSWLQRFGDSIYGTRGGPFPPTNKVAWTHRDNLPFVHVMDHRVDEVVVPQSQAILLEHRSLNGEAYTLSNGEEGIKINFPADRPHSIDTILALKFDGPVNSAFGSSGTK